MEIFGNLFCFLHQYVAASWKNKQGFGQVVIDFTLFQFLFPPLFSLIALDCWGPSGSREERHMGKKSLDDFPFLVQAAANLLHTP